MRGEAGEGGRGGITDSLGQAGCGRDWVSSQAWQDLLSKSVILCLCREQMGRQSRAKNTSQLRRLLW